MSNKLSKIISIISLAGAVILTVYAICYANNELEKAQSASVMWLINYVVSRDNK